MPIAGRRCACAGLPSVTFVAVRRPGKAQWTAPQKLDTQLSKVQFMAKPKYSLKQNWLWLIIICPVKTENRVQPTFWY